MSASPPRLADYLAHMSAAIERICRYVENLDENAFLKDPLVQDAVIRNIEIIGEASRKIEKDYPDFARAHPELPLAFAYQMRNAVAHGYFKIDFGLVWRTIENDLPFLFENLKAAQKNL